MTLMRRNLSGANTHSHEKHTIQLYSHPYHNPWHEASILLPKAHRHYIASSGNDDHCNDDRCKYGSRNNVVHGAFLASKVTEGLK